MFNCKFFSLNKNQEIKKNALEISNFVIKEHIFKVYGFSLFVMLLIFRSRYFLNVKKAIKSI